MKEVEIDLGTVLHGLPTTSLLLDEPMCDVEDIVTAMLIIDCHCLLGEGIVYDDVTHAILWTDILAKQFHKVQLNYSTIADHHHNKVIHTVYDLPKMLGSFGMINLKNNNNDNVQLPLLCAWEDGFQLYDIGSGNALSEMSMGEDVNPKQLPSRLNDGRVDPTGQRFICGGYNGDITDLTMKVYKVEQKRISTTDDTTTTDEVNVNDNKNNTLQLIHEPILDNIRVTNSICWSLDGNTMYLADSPTKQIHAYQYNPMNGNICHPKLLHTKPSNEVDVPDGSCVDADGYIWNAVWRSGIKQSCVQRIDPKTGHVVFTVHIPDGTSQVTCCCFGGKNLNILFITTSSHNCSHQKEPHAGGLYAVKLPFRGRIESRLQFQIK